MTDQPSSQFSDGDGTLLIRTWFDDPEAWRLTREACVAPSPEGFTANILALDDPGHTGATWQQLRDQGREHDLLLLLIADQRAQQEVGHPILVVSMDADDPATFRCPAEELWAVENNLSLCNMDWEEFTEHTVDGVFRGFPEHPLESP